MLLCLPRRMADKFVQLAPLKILPVPIELPRYKLTMLRSPLLQKDRAHERLRSLLLEASVNLTRAAEVGRAH